MAQAPQRGWLILVRGRSSTVAIQARYGRVAAPAGVAVGVAAEPVAVNSM